MRVAVTGGTGFLGAHLARALAARGDEVTCLDVVSSSALLDGVAVEVARCDVGFMPEVLHVFERLRPELVFHTAGILSAAAEERPQAAYRANLEGTFNVLEAALLLGGTRVVLTSTIATYGPGVPARVDESTQQRPTTMYGVSKVASELLGEYYWHRYGLDFRAARLPSVIGAGRGPGGASAYSSLIVSEPARGRAIKIEVDEAARIPIVYIKDAVAGLTALAEAPAAALRQRTYGLPGFSARADELAAAVRARVPEADITFAPDPALVEIVASWPEELDGAAAAADWGYEPAFGLEQAVADFVAEVERHPSWP